MFQSARIKLTLWYVLIIAVITVFFSLAAYRGFAFEFERGLGRDRVFVQQQEQGGPPRIFIRKPPDPHLIEEAHQRILLRIGAIDLIVIILSGIAGYFLAGLTLKPIKKMVDSQNLFIADASHELRTPLTAARTSLEVGIRDKNISLPESKELLESTLEDVTMIQSLADNLLLLAQLDHVGAPIAHQEVSLERVLTSAKSKVRTLAKKKGTEINLLQQQYMVLGNEDSLVELFIILFDNAIKYSEKNSSPIEVTANRTDGMVKVHVTDHGIGIGSKNIPHIFDRFYRVDKSRSKANVSGYGLGLSIAKKIAEEHRGSITVKSTQGKGAVFTVVLPMKKS